MANENNRKNLGIAKSFEEKEAAIHHAIAGVIERKGQPLPRGPRIVPGASNDTAVNVLKQIIERTQAQISDQAWIIRETKRNLQYQEDLLRSLRAAEQRDVDNIRRIARAAGCSKDEIQTLMHDMGQSCEVDECQDCCGKFVGHDYDPDEGGYCLICNHHPNA